MPLNTTPLAMKTGSTSRFWTFRSTTLALLILLLGTLPSAHAQTRLYETNLIIVRVGDGFQALTAGGNPVFFDQITTTGSYVSSVAVPNSGPSAVVLPGNSANDCFLTRSADGRYLTIAGYTTNTQAATISSSVPRVVLNIDALGNLQQPAVTTTDFSAAGWRCAATDGTNNYWGTGSAGGVVYLGNSSTHSVIENTKPNCRVVHMFNGSLYMSTLSTTGDTFTGIYKFNGMPKVNTPLPAPVIFTNTANTATSKGVDDFAVNPFNTTIYFADSRPYSLIEGGIQRWDYDNVHGVWVNTYHLTNGLPGDGLQNLVVDWTGTVPVLYATTIGNTGSSPTRVVKVTDTGINSPFSTLALSGVNQVYRGIRFGPVLSAPLIASQPVNQFTSVGGTATFTVTATGASPLAYQWRLNNSAIASATISSITITNAQVADAGTYQVIVTNYAGSVTSQQATLTVETNSPIILSLTSNVLTETGTTATMSVIVSSGGPVTYQWLYENAQIGGANSSSFSITNVQFSNAGNYGVIIGNLSGNTTSAPVRLTLFSPPQSTNVTVGDTATFSTQVVGPATPTFQWHFNGQDIFQATSVTFSVFNAQTTNAGFYSVVCSLPGISTVSSAAFLSVVANPTSNPPGSITAPIGLINWWPFDGNLKDVYGSNDASPVAGVAILNGEVGLGCYFDAATNTHLNVDGTPVPPPWTASCWVYHQFTPWVSSAIIGDKFTSLKLEQNRNTSKVGFTQFGIKDYSFNYICPVNEWTHLAWVSTTTNTSLYVNGAFQETITNTINLPRGQIGADFGGTIDHVLGTIDELMLFNRDLSATEIQSIYNAGSAGVLRVPEFIATSSNNSQFFTTLRGLTGRNFLIYGSNNLTSWLLITNAANTSGFVPFYDPFTSPGIKFYKAIQY
ncbi:MAG: hypothetical protein JWO95_2003 [Verrucomicrobiales bacterium]|nr:hypothetical protein [Verrucomicrobiales bacterium]